MKRRRAFNKKQKGVSLYLTISIMSVLLAIGLGMSLLLIGQIRIIAGIGDSVVAFYASDTGIERALYYLYKEGVMPADVDYSEILSDGSSYHVKGFSAGDPQNCPSPPNQYFCVKSTGTFKETKRGIEISK